MPTKKFAKEYMIDMVDDVYDKERFKVMKNDLVDSSRWSLVFELVFKEISSSKYYKSSYSVGATECQDEGPYEFDGDEIECFEVYPREVSTIEWVREQ